VLSAGAAAAIRAVAMQPRIKALADSCVVPPLLEIVLCVFQRDEIDFAPAVIVEGALGEDDRRRPAASAVCEIVRGGYGNLLS